MLIVKLPKRICNGHLLSVFPSDSFLSQLQPDFTLKRHWNYSCQNHQSPILLNPMVISQSLPNFIRQCICHSWSLLPRETIASLGFNQPLWLHPTCQWQNTAKYCMCAYLQYKEYISGINFGQVREYSKSSVENPTTVHEKEERIEVREENQHIGSR